MRSTVFVVSREGERWSVSADGQVYATARSEMKARELARKAATVLSASGAEAQVRAYDVVREEPRSFSPKDD